MKKTLDDSKITKKNMEYYGVIPCDLTIPIALFANESDSQEYAKIFDGMSKNKSRASSKGIEDYRIKKFLISPQSCLCDR